LVDIIIVRGDLDNKNHIIFYSEKDAPIPESIELPSCQLIENQFNKLLEENQKDFNAFMDNYHVGKKEEKNWLLGSPEFDYQHLRKILHPSDKDEFL
jgi:hypothetical protein